MNRFFSKLDLRDIKIDPTGSRFPPDGETVEDTEVEERYEEAAPVEASAPVEVVEETTTLTLKSMTTKSLRWCRNSCTSARAF